MEKTPFHYQKKKKEKKIHNGKWLRMGNCSEIILALIVTYFGLGYIGNFNKNSSNYFQSGTALLGAVEKSTSSWEKQRATRGWQ